MIFGAPQLDPREEAVLALIREQWTRLRWLLQDRPSRWTGFLRRSAQARGIRGSNSIEGYLVSADDAAAAVEGDEPYDTPVEGESWLAVRGYQQAMTHALQQASDPDSRLDLSLIRSLHYIMLGHEPDKHPGSWRPAGIQVHDDRVGQLVYDAPPRERVPELMGELVDRFRIGTSESALILAAMAHLNLAMIHPFSDGNGRMARCLQTFVLAKAGVFDPVFCSVEEWLGVPANTFDYYDVLSLVGQGSWQPQNDARPWIRFMLKAHYQQAATVERRQREVSEIWGAIEKVLEDTGLPERATAPLAEAAFGRAIRNSRYRQHADVNQMTASRDLKALVEAGLLERFGAKRGSYYRASKRLRAIRDARREKKAIPDPLTLVKSR